MDKLDWVNSSGGPLVLMDSGLAELWRGTIGNSGSSLAVTDYERACLINGFIGKVDVGGGEAIVLGDEPAQSAMVKIESGLFMVVRWVWADNEADVLKSLEGPLLSKDFEDCGFTIALPTGNPTLFDSALSNGIAENGAVLITEPGKYRASTLWHRPTPNLNIIVHQFALKSDWE